MTQHLEQRTEETIDTWQTPAWLVEQVRCFGGGIALDPCTTDHNPTCAARWSTPNVDGLGVDWTRSASGGLVYVNPPYGAASKAWSAKAINEASFGANILFLCPARTETQWFGSLWDHAQAVALFRRRIRFVRPPADALTEDVSAVLGASDSPKFPSALFLFTHVPGALQVFKAQFDSVARVVALGETK